MIKDDHGHFVAASNTRIEHVNSAAIAEARALKLERRAHPGRSSWTREDNYQLGLPGSCSNYHDGGFSATKASAIYEECVF